MVLPIGLQDLLLTPIYLVIIYGVLYVIKYSIKDKVMKEYFMISFSIKVVGAIAFGLVFQFFYGYGDTFFYFSAASIAREAFLNDPWVYFKILLAPANSTDPDLYYYMGRMPYYEDHSSFVINKIASVFSILSFNTYTIVSILFALLCFAGSWQMYKAWCDIYPVLKTQIARATFFIPSVVFWGSGILKDSVTFAALCFAFAAFHFGIIRRKNVILNIVIFLISCKLLLDIKMYILLCFIPACAWWFYAQNNKQIKSRVLRVFIAPILLSFGVAVGYTLFFELVKDTEYDLDRVAQRAFITADWIRFMSKEGSAYDVGIDQMDGTINSLIRLMPKGAFITLFRPFVWEAINPLMLLAALENLFLLYLTIQIFRGQKLGIVIRRLSTQPMVVVCLIFTLFFAGIIGVVSSNFGTLARYRIPLLPFYMIALIIMGYKPPKARPIRRNPSQNTPLKTKTLQS